MDLGQPRTGDTAGGDAGPSIALYLATARTRPFADPGTRLMLMSPPPFPFAPGRAGDTNNPICRNRTPSRERLSDQRLGALQDGDGSLESSPSRRYGAASVCPTPHRFRAAAQAKADGAGGRTWTDKAVRPRDF